MQKYISGRYAFLATDSSRAGNINHFLPTVGHRLSSFELRSSFLRIRPMTNQSVSYTHLLEVHSLVEAADEALTIEEQFTSSSVRYLRIATSHYREIIAGGLCADDLNLPVREQSEEA